MMQTAKKDLFHLIQKYNVPGPRYTSYPTALHFREQQVESVLQTYLYKRAEKARPMSLYFHIPFCFSLCWYCGCTKIITKNKDRGDIYLQYLQKEAALVSKTLHRNSAARQIHFGGGTPTFLTPSQLRRLGEIIHHYFFVDPSAEFSVEIDPRTCTEEHIVALQEIGVNRASLGVQDTNENVQKAIHRIQPFEQTERVTNDLRKHGIESINFDLIYGLPLQTTGTFSKTLDEVLTLQPNRLAIYSYAHLPSVMPAQKLLNEEEFPSTEDKLAMLVNTIDQLPGEGYRFIGMDHFAREDDELSRALDDGTLQRNFQGYSTHAELEMIALGMSGISMGDDLYYQNTKDLAEYYNQLEEGRLPVKKILPLSDEDRLRRLVIMKIMCRGEISYKAFFKETDVDFGTTFSREIMDLDELEEDHLLVRDEYGFRVTTTGRLFLRNVAMVFDGYRENKTGRIQYSTTV